MNATTLPAHVFICKWARLGDFQPGQPKTRSHFGPPASFEGRSWGRRSKKTVHHHHTTNRRAEPWEGANMPTAPTHMWMNDSMAANSRPGQGVTSAQGVSLGQGWPLGAYISAACVLHVTACAKAVSLCLRLPSLIVDGSGRK